jgi:hypothetical protein
MQDAISGTNPRGTVAGASASAAPSADNGIDAARAMVAIRALNVIFAYSSYPGATLPGRSAAPQSVAANSLTCSDFPPDGDKKRNVGECEAAGP